MPIAVHPFVSALIRTPWLNAHLPPVEEPPPNEDIPDRPPPDNEPPDPPIQEPPLGAGRRARRAR